MVCVRLCRVRARVCLFVLVESSEVDAWLWWGHTHTHNLVRL